MKAKAIFIILKIDGHNMPIDYPQNLPLPRIGEVIIFNKLFLTVDMITYNISDDLSIVTISIYCK